MAPVLHVLLAAMLLLSGIQASSAQHYPTRPVRVVVGFPAGGPTDVIARMVAQKLSDKLGQQFFVENVGGAGGNTAAGQVARATPDGYTIMAISTGFVVNPSLYAKVPYDPIKDFAPVTLVAVSPNVVVVNPAVPAKSLPELVQLIKNNPGKYSFAGPGVGSTPHLGGELFRLAFNLDLVHVPFTGAGRRYRRRSVGIRQLPSQRCRPPCRQYRLASFARLALRRPIARFNYLTFRPSPNRASRIRKPTRSPASSRRPERRRKSLICSLARSPGPLAQPDVKERLMALGFKPVANKPDEFGHASSWKWKNGVRWCAMRS